MPPATPFRVSQLHATQGSVTSVQRSMPAGNTEWHTRFRIGQLEIEEIGVAHLGRPHGIDNDLLIAAQTLYTTAGFPPDGLVDTTAHTLLRLAGHNPNGEGYTRMRESLLRLRAVQWTTSRYLWTDDNRHAIGGTIATGFFAQVELPEVLTPTQDRDLIPDARLRIYLTPAFAKSIREGEYMLLDASLLERLDQPGARALYAKLQSHRVQDDESLAGKLTVTLRDWLTACVITARIDSAKDTLHRAADSLIKAGYLDKVDWTGRGMNAVLTYHFARAHADPDLVALLREMGVSRPVAESLAADHPERIRPTVQNINTQVENGFKPRNLAAVITDAVRNPDKYPARPALTPARRAKPTPTPLPDIDRRTAIRNLFKLKLRRDLDMYERLTLQEMSDDGLTALSRALTDGQYDLAQRLLN